jgi:hypothetical protein
MKQWEIRGLTDDSLEVPHVPAGSSEVPQVQADPSEVPHVLVEQLPIVAWTTDPVLEFTSSDGSELEGLRLGPNQIVGLTLFDLLDTDDPRHPAISAHLRALGGETVPFEMRLSDRMFHGRVSPLLDGEGEQIGTICAAIEDASADLAVVEAMSALVSVE